QGDYVTRDGAANIGNTESHRIRVLRYGQDTLYLPQMGARLDPAPAVRIPDLVDLRKISSAHLDTLLEEETREWNEALDWDFRKSADLVCRFVDLRALSGCALMDQGEAAGYSYFVLEDQKGLIGDLYVRPRYRTAE